MRSDFLSLAIAFVCACLAPQTHAQAKDTWTGQFESTFSATGNVGSVSFMYPKQFELNITTMGVFLETKEISGQISSGLINIRSKYDATELLINKQGGKIIKESATNNYTIFASTSIQGEQICMTYIVVPKNNYNDPLYVQFRWESQNPVDYTSMLDQIITTIQ